jgi:signal transduction histidine kinase
MERFPDATPVERRASRLKRELIWASALFAVMFLAVLGLGSAILIKDLSSKEVFRLIQGYSQELERLMAKLPTEQVLKGYKQKTIVTTQLNAFLTEKQIFDSVELYDENGKLIHREDRLQGGEVQMGGSGTGLLPGQRRIETKDRIPITVPVPIEPGKMGRAILSVSQDVLARKTSDFRSELVAKLMAMMAIILFMLGISYLYVLRVLRLSRRLEAQAQDQKRLSALGLISSGMAHEIKNPLNSIQMNLQMLEEELLSGTPPSEAAVWLDPMRKEIRRLERLVNEFLLYARPMVPQLRETSVAALLESIATLVAEEARRQGISVRVECAVDGPDPLLDEGLLRTALLNLVLNAIQAPQEGGHIVLRARREEQMLLFEVEDQGPGVPPHKREEVFEIFYTTKVGGTGLGLPISRRILEGLGGTLTLVPKEPPGALFRATLPYQEAEHG